jgi:hypothetical protein
MDRSKSHLDYLKKSQAKAIEVARAIIDGKIGIIEGSRALVAIRHEVTDELADSDFLPFIAVESETDTLPVGNVRQHWAKDALANEDIKINKYENEMRDMIIAACERLIQKVENKG